MTEWTLVVAVLDAQLPDVEDALSPPGAAAAGVVFKTYEDMLDAVVCVCVAICVLEGEALPYGDDSAIWIPKAREVTRASPGG